MINFPLNKVYLESVDSTNSYLKRIVKEGELTSGLAVMAKVQTAGRGRLGRNWLSTESNTLCMSIVIKNDYAEGLTLLTALAVYEGLKGFCNESLQIKWPNDIICGEKKLCGILCERALEYTVIGIGVNVNDQSFHSEIKNKATSLYLLSGKEYELKKVFESLVSSFEKVFEKFGFSFCKEAKEMYESLCVNFGRSVTTEKLSGTAVGIDINGSLLVETEGALHTVSSGEVAVHGIY